MSQPSETSAHRLDVHPHPHCAAGTIQGHPSSNQDYALVRPGLLVIADGVGSLEGSGDVSKAAAHDVHSHYHSTQVRQRFFPLAKPFDPLQTLGEAVRLADVKLFARMFKKGAQEGATTLTAVALTRGKLHVAHVGNSRLYRLRDGRMDQLTPDHDIFWARSQGLAVARGKGPLSRAIQAMHGNGVDLTAASHDIRSGDRLVLTTDGVHDHLTDARLAQLVRENEQPQDAVDAILGRLRKQPGGPADDATVIVYHV